MKHQFLKLLAAAALAGLAAVAAAPVFAEGELAIPEGNTANQLLEVQSDTSQAKGTSTPSISTLAASTSITVGSGTAITKIVVYTASLTSNQIAANSCTEVAITVSGLTTDDKVFVNPTFLMGTEGFIASARVAAADDLVLVLCNPNSASADIETGTLNVLAVRS